MPRITKAECFRNIENAQNIRKIANNTWQYEHDGETVIRLHFTDIIRKTSDGKMVLNTGGWKTHTTKDRFNTMTKYRIYSDKGIWYVGNGVPYYDGMVLPDALDDFDPDEAKARIKEVRAVKRKLKKFVAQLDDLERLPAPNGGDCWGCNFSDPSKRKKLGSWGRDTYDDSDVYPMGRDCVKGHVDEDYLHGSLIVRAMRWCGYRDEGIAHYLAYGPSDSVKRALYRFLKHKHGLA